MNKKKYSTFSLFKYRGSTTIGMATILNIKGNFFDYNYTNSNENADFRAIQNDWGVVGQDIHQAIQKFKSDS